MKLFCDIFHVHIINNTCKFNQKNCGEICLKLNLLTFFSAFLLWYLSRILALLGHEQCSKVHKLTLEVIHKLLQAVKNRDFYTYQSILDEILLCLTGKVCHSLCHSPLSLYHHIPKNLDTPKICCNHPKI